MEEYEIISVTEENLADEHICCAIGNDARNKKRSEVKKAWMKECLKQGLQFKKINIRGKAFIEYIPAEYAWKPVSAPGYNLIHCLWISGKYKKQGLSKELMELCFEDSKDKNGICVVTADKTRPFLTDKKFYAKFGFATCDTAPPYFELMVKKNNKDAPDPIFNESAKSLNVDSKKGFTFVYTNQCTFPEDVIREHVAVLEEKQIPYTVKQLKTVEEAQNSPSAFTTFAYFIDGQFQSHVMPGYKEFGKLVENYGN